MQIIYYLGELISEKIGISPSASRGLLKLSIKDEFGPYESLESLGLTHYQKVIQNSLKKRFIDLKVENFEKLVNLLLDELMKHQSLLTMEKI
jgi:hypothetical protein